MPGLVWDEVGDRLFETGVDKGVLYLPVYEGGELFEFKPGVAWNGLISIEDQTADTLVPYYVDGIKFVDSRQIGDFTAVLKAYTYPDEFEEIQGVGSKGEGVFFTGQRGDTFGLSYRSLLGNDQQSIEYGYKLHLLYNLTVAQDVKAYETMANQISPIEFSWTINGVPLVVPNFRPTSHIIVDTTKLAEGVLDDLERILYGLDGAEPRLPSYDELLQFVDAENNLITIVDNEDGTWTAIGPDHLISMLSETEFEIQSATTVDLDEDTYTISSTPLP